MPAPATYPVETICKLLDLTPRRLQQLAAEGVLPRGERGRYDLLGCVRGYVRHLRDRTLPADIEADPYHQQRTRRTAAEAEIAELKVAQARGELVLAAEAARAWASHAARVRSRFLAIPSDVGQALPELTKHELAVADHLVRDALLDASRVEEGDLA